MRVTLIITFFLGTLNAFEIMNWKSESGIEMANCNTIGGLCCCGDRNDPTDDYCTNGLVCKVLSGQNGICVCKQNSENPDCQGCGELFKVCCSSGNPCQGGLVCRQGVCVPPNLPPHQGCIGGGGDGGGGGGGGGSPFCGHFFKKIGDATVYKLEPYDPDLRFPAILLVHGLNSDCSSMENFLRWFKDDNYRVFNVSLYKVEWFRGGFFANGKLLKVISDTIYNYLFDGYPDFPNNKIIAVAHSRGGLDVENAIAYHGANIPGILSLGTPWFGSRLADACFSIPATCPWWLFPICGAIIAVVEIACFTISGGEFLILNTPYLFAYRSSLPANNITYDLGIGYDTHSLCGNFEKETYKFSCIFLRYFQGEWGNDGAVGGKSVYFMQYAYPNRTRFLSPQCWSNNNCPPPGEWREEHPDEIRSYEIYRDVESRIRTSYSQTFLAVNLPQNPNSNSFNQIEEELKKVESAGYITYIVPNETLRLVMLGNANELTLTTFSQKQLITNPSTEFQICDSCIDFKFIYVYRNRKGIDTLSITANEPSVAVLGFITPIKTILKRDKVIYGVGEVANLELKLPPDKYKITAFYFRNTDSIVDTISFIKQSPTIYKSQLPLTKEGYYTIFVQADGNIYKRTFIMTLLATTSIPPNYINRAEKDQTSQIYQNQITINEKTFKYRIYDLTGRLIKEGHSDNGKVHLNDLKKGLYIVKIKNKTYKVLVK
jgi:pimeloyl-ACP methyl ester carboxylesterase